MKRLGAFFAIILLVTAGCGGNRQGNRTDGIITVDVTKNYPQRELILQDFMDVEYIALETGGEFYTQGLVLAIGKEIILVKNQVNDGDIFVFDKTGKGIRKFNRKGQGGEEYVTLKEVFLDEDREEIFVCDNSSRKTIVYDFYGKFKRSFRFNEGARYQDVYNYDRDCFIWWNSAFEYSDESVDMPSFFISSKQDGSNIKEIRIPVENRKSTRISSSSNPETAFRHFLEYRAIIPFLDQWILFEISSDTMYRYLPDHSVQPFLVRTPSIQIQSMTDVFLFPNVFSDRYYFVTTVKNDFDFATMSSSPTNPLMYDRQEKSMFTCVVYNDDYSNKRRGHVNMAMKPLSGEIALYMRLNADELVENYEKGELKVKLKEIAVTLKEESNPVIMLVKHKK